MRIAVIGTGYVGLVTGTCLADMGNEVVGVDTDPAKLAVLKRGQAPLFEPGLEDIIRRNLKEGRLRFTENVAEALVRAHMCFIAVGTPPDGSGGADKSGVLQAAATVAREATDALLLVVKSTVPVGTCEEVQDLVCGVLAQRRVSFAIDVVSNPEFLKEGKAVDDFMRPDRIVVGASASRADTVMRGLYRHFLRNGHPYLSMDLRSAEMSKYAANAMLAARVSLINELARICDGVGADIMNVRRAVGTDRRIGMDFLYAGVGYGGSCLPKDVLALSRLAVESGCPTDILEAVDRVNRHQGPLLARRILTRFGGRLNGRRLSQWGLAFKPNTDDVRNAPALTLVRLLLDAGAEVQVYDPVASANARIALAGAEGLTFASDMYAALDGADALVLATEWTQFRRPDFERMRRCLAAPVVFDGRNQYEPEEMAALGFEYHCIGRAASQSSSPM